MAFAFIFPIRIAQAILAILVLGLLAYVASVFPYHWSPSQVNFLIFAAVWTLLVLLYLELTPRAYPTAAHHFAILAAEFVTMIFWFAGFIALAVFLTSVGCTGSGGSVCSAAIAGDVFAAFEWVLFMITMVLASLHSWGRRGEYAGKHSVTAPVPV